MVYINVALEIMVCRLNSTVSLSKMTVSHSQLDPRNKYRWTFNQNTECYSERICRRRRWRRFGFCNNMLFMHRQWLASLMRGETPLCKQTVVGTSPMQTTYRFPRSVLRGGCHLRLLHKHVSWYTYKFKFKIFIHGKHTVWT